MDITLFGPFGLDLVNSLISFLVVVGKNFVMIFLGTWKRWKRVDVVLNLIKGNMFRVFTEDFTLIQGG